MCHKPSSPFRLASLLLLCALVVSLQAVPSLRAYAGDPIQILSQSAEGALSKSIKFMATVKSLAGQIVAANLVAGMPGHSTYTFKANPKAPAAQVNLQFTWNISRDDDPPWQLILYHWEIRDSAGNRLVTPQTTGEIVDKSHAWQKLTDNKVSVYFYDQTDGFGSALLKATQRAYNQVRSATQHTPQYEIRVVIYNNQEDFCAYHVANGCLQWSGGETYYGITVQYVDEERDPTNIGLFEQVLPHELAHAFLNEWLGTRIREIPSWFDEGQAVNNQIDGIDYYLARAMAMANSGRLWRIRELGNPSELDPNDDARVYDWYAEATSLVAYLFRKWGTASLGKIVNEMLDGSSFAAAFEDVTGLNLDQYEVKWRLWLGAAELPTATPTPPM